MASLATRVGMWRTAFAPLFAELVEGTPIDHLTRWRMHLAAQRVAGPDKRQYGVALSRDVRDRNLPLPQARAQ